MVTKAKPPQEDPETKARREQAEQLARERQLGETQEGASRQTDELFRRFGSRLAMSGMGLGNFGTGSPESPIGRPGGGPSVRGGGGGRGGIGGGLGGGVQLY